MNKSQPEKLGDHDKGGAYSMDKSNFVPTERNTATRDNAKKRWYKTLISYKYTLRGKDIYFYEDDIIHDKTFVPIWILALLAYICVIILIVIVLYFYE